MRGEIAGRDEVREGDVDVAEAEHDGSEPEGAADASEDMREVVGGVEV